jgi:hypothetical protein
MSRHRSDLTKTQSAYDFDVVTDPPRPFKVRDVASELPAPGPSATPSETPGESAAEDMKAAISPHPTPGFDFGNP